MSTTFTPAERRAAYSLLASMFAQGTVVESEEVMNTAICVVMSDERKSRTKAERTLQTWVGANLLIGWAMREAFAD